ncbi:DgyrCDS10024 [Dimorphilus gyrociliatus]|uniref:DgyrCDS10024 n=1 Tax=Dimorphilus gyrociliatus TaxID=2664684 RepID=A0A7I8W105_9ANNE|nr:DgyrCDS10024 [Dimorphilus gyrociliatus]
MKINDNMLAMYANHRSRKPTKEGYLFKRGEINQQYQLRHCVLRANMLFYSEGPNQQPLGVIILEGATVDFLGIEPNPKLVNKSLNIKKLHLFVIQWKAYGQNLRRYTLGCEKTEDIDDWMNKIVMSSYSFMRKVHTELKKQLDTLQNVPTRPPLPEKRKSFEELHEDLRQRISEMCPNLNIISKSDSQIIDLGIDEPNSPDVEDVEEESENNSGSIEAVEPDQEETLSE